MSLCASSDSEFGLASVCESARLMLPEPPLPLVVMTRLPLFNRVSTVVHDTCDGPVKPPTTVSPGLVPGASKGVRSAGESAALEIRTSLGSSSRVPARPRAADRSVRAWKSRCWWPDTSAKPPSPPPAPPRALTPPNAWVARSDQTITVPPLPRPVASAFSVAPAPTSVVSALGRLALAPCRSPPTRRRPPPVAPDADSVALPSMPISCPRTSMAPPVPVAPVASTSPRTTVVAPDWITTCPPREPEADVVLPSVSVVSAIAFSTMRPPSRATPTASTCPCWLSEPANNPTAPPLIRPRLTARSPAACTSNVMPSRPDWASVTLRPAASTTEPPRVAMSPCWTMSGLTSVTSPLPPSMRPAAWMEPPSPAKARRPARKSASLMESVEARKPWVSTRLPAPKITPFGLTRNTLPLLVSDPRSADGSRPVTRFSTTLAALFCWKRVVSPAPIENDPQLMMAPGVLVTVSCLPAVENVAPPLTTTGAAGFAWTADDQASAMPRASAAGRKPAAPRRPAGRPGRWPPPLSAWLRAHSGTGTSRPVACWITRR